MYARIKLTYITVLERFFKICKTTKTKELPKRFCSERANISYIEQWVFFFPFGKRELGSVEASINRNVTTGLNP